MPIQNGTFTQFINAYLLSKCITKVIVQLWSLNKNYVQLCGPFKVSWQNSWKVNSCVINKHHGQRSVENMEVVSASVAA